MATIVPSYPQTRANAYPQTYGRDVGVEAVPERIVCVSRSVTQRVFAKSKMEPHVQASTKVSRRVIASTAVTGCD